MNKKKNNAFIAQGMILAGASILVRLIGLLYNSPVTAIIGDKGNGMYSYAYAIYTILLLLSSYSLPLAVSKMISARAEQGQWKNVQRIFYCAIIFGLCIGTTVGLLVLFGARFFTTTVYNSELAAIALRFMAPTILIMSILGVFRGFFQGLHTTKQTAISQILEQIVHAIVAIVMAYVLFGYGKRMNEVLHTENLEYAWGAAGAAIGTGMGALAALLYFCWNYTRERGSLNKLVQMDRTNSTESYKNLFRMLIFIAVPVIISTAMYNLIDLVDGAVFSSYMSSQKQSDIADTIWGAYNRKCLLMIHIPVSISSAMAASLVPSLTAAHQARRKREVKQKITAILKFITVIAFPSAIGLFVLAAPIIKLLFPSDTSNAALYLRMASPAVIVFSLSTITNSILQGIDRVSVPVKHSVISLCIHLLATVICMWGFKMGIYGIIAGYVIFGLSMCIQNFYSVMRLLGYKPNWMKIVIMPAICAVLMGVICFAVYQLLHLFAGSILPMGIAIFVSIVVYFYLIIKTGLMTEKELSELPKGSALVRIARKLHFL